MSKPTAATEAPASRPDSTRTGPGRLLIAVYGLFALAATARAAVQIATKFDHAPVAYLLSAFAGVVYILATVTLIVGSPGARRIAVVSCSVELVGVLAVGTWSLADPDSSGAVLNVAADALSVTVTPGTPTSSLVLSVAGASTGDQAQCAITITAGAAVGVEIVPPAAHPVP